MSDQRMFFQYFTPIDAGTYSVTGIGDTKLDVLGKGNIPVTILFNNVPTSHTLLDVLFIPGLRTNLFSIRAATCNGLKVRFVENKVYLQFLFIYIYKVIYIYLGLNIFL